MQTENNYARPKQFDVAILIVRIACAIAFLYHGSQILFGALGGPGPVGFAAFMHAPAVVGYLVGLAQFCGGLAMLTGLFVRIGAVCIMVVMLGAIFLVHAPHGYSITQNGYEYALTQLLIAFAVLISGSGAYSLAAVMPGPLRKL